MSSRPDPSWLDGVWQKRVFIGTSYNPLGQIAASVAADELRHLGLVPIVASAYDPLPVLPTDFHRDSLYKLHNCRCAIFEVTTPAGQLLELERARDFDIITLVVYQARHGIYPSRMVQHLIVKMRNWGLALAECVPYGNLRELRGIIYGVFRGLA